MTFRCRLEHLYRARFIVPLGVIAGYIVIAVVRRTKTILRKNALKAKVERCLKVRQTEMERIEKNTEAVDMELYRLVKKTSVEKLLELLRTRNVTCLHMLQVFQKLALEAQQRTNCLVKFLPDAESTAIALDIAGTDTNYEKPPLFGLPISIKSSIAIKGVDTFAGFAANLEQAAAEDAVLVRQLRALGAVPFVSTAVPQSLLTFSCENPVYGATRHPCRPDRTSGGSSGGEAALLAQCGSPLGLGSDVGGSIRIPAAWCGIVGIKPSHLRFSRWGSRGSIPGRSHTYGTNGPMAKTVRDCVVLLQAIWRDGWTHEHDPYVPPVLFRNELYLSKKKLKIGYYLDDGWFTPTPAAQRAVRETIASLKDNGHRLIPFQPHDMHALFRMAIVATTVDNGKTIAETISNDLPVDGYGRMLRLIRLPIWLRQLSAVTLGRFTPRLKTMALAYNRDIGDLRLNNVAVETYQREFFERWHNVGLDCLLCPVQVTPPQRHKEPYDLQSTVSYTILYNVLDYAAGVVPVTTVSAQDVRDLTHYPTNDPWSRMVKESAKDTEGLPMAVQIVAPPFHEEVVLRVMREIEDRVGN